MDELIWLKWRVTEDGRVEIVETRERDGELVRERRDAPSVEAAAEHYGEGFCEVVRTVVESGSRQGRFRP